MTCLLSFSPSGTLKNRDYGTARFVRAHSASAQTRLSCPQKIPNAMLRMCMVSILKKYMLSIRVFFRKTLKNKKKLLKMCGKSIIFQSIFFCISERLNREKMLMGLSRRLIFLKNNTPTTRLTWYWQEDGGGEVRW